MVPQRDMPAPVWWPRMWNGRADRAGGRGNQALRQQRLRLRGSPEALAQCWIAGSDTDDSGPRLHVGTFKLPHYGHNSSLDIRTKQEHCPGPREPDCPSGFALWINKGKNCGPPALDRLLLRPARGSGRFARTYVQGAPGGDRRCLAGAVGGTGGKGGDKGRVGSPAAWRARRRLTAA